MSLTTYLVVDVSYVSGRYKKRLKKQVLVMGQKQNRQAVKADILTRLAG